MRALTGEIETLDGKNSQCCSHAIKDDQHIGNHDVDKHRSGFLGLRAKKMKFLRMRLLFIVCLEDQKHRGSWSQSSHRMQMYPNVMYHTQICEKLIKLCHITGSAIGFCSVKTACL